MINHLILGNDFWNLWIDTKVSIMKLQKEKSVADANKAKRRLEKPLT
jgi:hypothetical protein